MEVPFSYSQSTVTAPIHSPSPGDEKLLSERRKEYSDIFEALAEFVGVNASFDPHEMARMLRKMIGKIFCYGSRETVSAFRDFMNEMAAARTLDNVILRRAFSKLVMAMRKDLGHQDEETEEVVL